MFHSFALAFVVDPSLKKGGFLHCGQTIQKHFTDFSKNISWLNERDYYNK
jgi:hypothetical protein